MLYKFFSWYSSTPLGWRRFFIAALVPFQEYVFLEPCRQALNSIAKVSPSLAIASLPILLLFGVLTAAVISLFIYEFYVGIGYKIRNRAGGMAFAVCLFGWVIFPLHFIG